MTSSVRTHWATFKQDGHEFVSIASREWQCSRCGATKDARNSTGLPDDSWAKLLIGGREFSQIAGDFETCDEALVLVVMIS